MPARTSDHTSDTIATETWKLSDWACKMTLAIVRLTYKLISSSMLLNSIKSTCTSPATLVNLKQILPLMYTFASVRLYLPTYRSVLSLSCVGYSWKLVQVKHDTLFHDAAHGSFLTVYTSSSSLDSPCLESTKPGMLFGGEADLKIVSTDEWQHCNNCPVPQ